MLSQSRQQGCLHELPGLAPDRLTSPLPRQRPRPIAGMRCPPLLTIQNKRVSTGRMQTAALVSGATDGDRLNLVMGADWSEFDCFIQLAPVGQLAPIAPPARTVECWRRLCIHSAPAEAKGGGSRPIRSRDRMSLAVLVRRHEPEGNTRSTSPTLAMLIR